MGRGVRLRRGTLVVLAAAAMATVAPLGAGLAGGSAAGAHP